ncbi:TonB-dependent receptor [Bacteroides fragilis]|nr:TonB-dependent receptor [Bacteroides fragilis]
MGVIGIGSPDLKWEKNKAFNLGLVLTFWDRLSLTLDYYTRKTNDLLMNKRISYVSRLL